MVIEFGSVPSGLGDMPKWRLEEEISVLIRKGLPL
jgi:hypothetical protein